MTIVCVCVCVYACACCGWKAASRKTEMRGYRCVRKEQKEQERHGAAAHDERRMILRSSAVFSLPASKLIARQPTASSSRKDRQESVHTNGTTTAARAAAAAAACCRRRCCSRLRQRRRAPIRCEPNQRTLTDTVSGLRAAEKNPPLPLSPSSTITTSLTGPVAPRHVAPETVMSSAPVIQTRGPAAATGGREERSRRKTAADSNR